MVDHPLTKTIMDNTTNTSVNLSPETVSAFSQVQVIEARQKAEFAMTPVGQMLEKFKAQQRIAQVYAASSLIPQSLKGDPNKEYGATPVEKQAAANQKTLANCVIALNMATRMKADPLMVMQNLYIVYGQPAFSSKFLIACINASGRYSTLQYEMTGTPGTPEFGCHVVAFEATDTKHKTPLVGPTVTLAMAKAEGWESKNGSKWRTMPEVMLRYRAAAFWQRQFCPEISMGLSTAEEAYDMGQQPVQYAEEIPARSLDNIAAQAMLCKKKPEQEATVSVEEAKAAEAAAPTAELSVSAVDTGGHSMADPVTEVPQPTPQGNPLEEENSLL